MFKYKTDAEVQAMTEQEANDYAIAKRAYESDLQATAIKTAVEAVKEELKSEVDKANEKATQLSLEVSELKTKNGNATPESFTTQFKNFLSENIDKLKQIQKTGSGVIDFTYKAVEIVTTANGTNTAPPTLVGTQLAPLTNVNLRDFDITNLTTNVNTKQAAYAYTEVIPKDGDFGFVAEGAVKPQTDFSWTTNYAKPVKAAAWIKLTDESIQDVDGLESVARDLLFKKHNIKKSKGILFGDGIAPNPKGATSYGRVFSAGPLALAVSNPNFMDVINAAITDIATTHNYEDETPYVANLVLINPNDFFINLVSAKDADGKPLYPTATLFNEVKIGGLTIKSEETIPVGKIFVGDMEKYNTTNYVPYNVQLGWVNDDFIKNQFVMLAESRFHAFVRVLDQQAFIYDNISAIKNAITKP